MTNLHYPRSYNPDMKPGETIAEYCRRMGYKPGTRLIGDEGYGPTTLLITAIGERRILARTITDRGPETVWDLSHRHWKPTS